MEVTKTPTMKEKTGIKSIFSRKSTINSMSKEGGRPDIPLPANSSEQQSNELQNPINISDKITSSKSSTPMSSDPNLVNIEDDVDDLLVDLEMPLSSDSGSNLTPPKLRKSATKFKALFPDVTEPLVANFACAFEIDILWQGRMYITRSSIFFYSKIFINETKLSIPFSDIVTLEKAVYVLPNGIRIHTPETKYMFASFLKRDTVYDHLQSSIDLFKKRTSNFDQPLIPIIWKM
ncbi:hypothetical protein BC833DRAFT_166043 [Globomyces pollinis-pini]|nr:hypothetical protein BC833DRAFT_166043 [Globomyces pollinis-pini]